MKAVRACSNVDRSTSLASSRAEARVSIEDVLTVLHKASQPLGLTGAEWLRRQGREL